MLKSILWKPLSCITYIILVQPLCNFTLSMAVSRLSSVQNLKAIGELRTRFWTNEIPRDLNLSGISQEKVYCIKLFSSILRWLPSLKHVSLINIHGLIFCNYLWLFTKSHTTTYTDRTNIHNTLYHDIDSFRVMWVRCSYKISCRKISQFRSHAMCPLECHIVLNFDRRIGGSGAANVPVKFQRGTTILTQSCAVLKLWDLAIRSHIRHYWNMPMVDIW